jgi:hypothetical protein
VAKRDPNKTARHNRIAAMNEQLRVLVTKVLKETGIDSKALNAQDWRP